MTTTKLPYGPSKSSSPIANKREPAEAWLRWLVMATTRGKQGIIQDNFQLKEQSFRMSMQKPLLTGVDSCQWELILIFPKYTVQ